MTKNPFLTHSCAKLIVWRFWPVCQVGIFERALKRHSKVQSLRISEHNFDNPHPPILAENIPPKYGIKWGDVWRKIPGNKGTFTEDMVYELRLYGMQTPTFLCHMNADFYAI